MGRSTEMDMTPGRDKITAATSSASLYDNVNNTSATPGKIPKIGDLAKKEKQNETCQTTPKTANIGIGTVTVGSQASIGLSNMHSSHYIQNYRANLKFIKESTVIFLFLNNIISIIYSIK